MTKTNVAHSPRERPKEKDYWQMDLNPHQSETQFVDNLNITTAAYCIFPPHTLCPHSSVGLTPTP